MYLCIYLIKRSPPCVQEGFSKFCAGDIDISSSSVAELEYVVKKSAAPDRCGRVLEAFFLPLEIVSFSTMTAQAYGIICAVLERRRLIPSSLELLIAAVTIFKKCLLVTHN